MPSFHSCLGSYLSRIALCIAQESSRRGASASSRFVSPRAETMRQVQDVWLESQARGGCRYSSVRSVGRDDSCPLEDPVQLANLVGVCTSRHRGNWLVPANAAKSVPTSVRHMSVEQLSSLTSDCETSWESYTHRYSPIDSSDSVRIRRS